jgi:hypothetical protein
MAPQSSCLPPTSRRTTDGSRRNDLREALRECIAQPNPQLVHGRPLGGRSLKLLYIIALAVVVGVALFASQKRNGRRHVIVQPGSSSQTSYIYP